MLNAILRAIYREEKKMKKVLAILLAAVLLFSLVACGGQDEKASDTEPVTESESAEADADAPDAAPGGL